MLIAVMLLLIGFVIAGGLVPLVEALTFVGACLLGIVEVAETLRPGTILPRAKVCELGRDGIRAGSRFVRWKRVKSAEVARVAWGTKRSGEPEGVVLRIAGGNDLRLVVSEPERLMKCVERALRAARRPRLAEQSDYRTANQLPKEDAEAIAADPSETQERRVRALAQLDEPERLRVLESLVEPGVEQALRAKVSSR